MQSYNIEPIGVIKAEDGEFCARLEPRYAEGLRGLEGFSHVMLLWWFSGCDDESSRATLTVAPPYKSAPGDLGVFATRSPRRPNPIAVETAEITYVDAKSGEVGIAWSEAFDGTPLLDIKPYEPSLDRVERPQTPAWCAHWPRSLEESGEFDWGAEMGEG